MIVQWHFGSSQCLAECQGNGFRLGMMHAGLTSCLQQAVLQAYAQGIQRQHVQHQPAQQDDRKQGAHDVSACQTGLMLG